MERLETMTENSSIADPSLNPCIITHDHALEDVGSLVSSLSDIGSYCYCSLVSVALNRLYSDSKSRHDSAFIDHAVELVTCHLHQPQRVCATALIIAHSIHNLRHQPFVDCLKEDGIFKAHDVCIIPKDLIVVSLKQGVYDARMRTLIKFVSSILQVKWAEIETFEEIVGKTFQELEHVATEEEKAEKEKKAKHRKYKRIAIITAATVGGGVLIGVTGGLAAPLIAAATVPIIGTAGAIALGSTAGIAVMTSLFGVAGAKLIGSKMSRRVGDIEEFTFEPLTEGSSLHITIAITGWISEEYPDYTYAWRGMACSKEQYVLRYESKYLKEMANGMRFLVDLAVSEATKQALKMTILGGLIAAVAWPSAILKVGKVIDNPWNVLTNRTKAVGRMLAEVLLDREQGKRPVTLIGFSVGARVIYYCLKEMSKRKNCEGIVENAIMLGAPVSAKAQKWVNFKRVVAGKVINGFCRSDWLLRFLYRTASVQYSIAGLSSIEWKDRRMVNIDLTEVVDGHMDYMKKLDQILEIVGVKTKPHAKIGVRATLKDWVAANKQRSSANVKEETLLSDHENLKTDNFSAKSKKENVNILIESRKEKEGDRLVPTIKPETGGSQLKEDVTTIENDICDKNEENLHSLASSLVNNAMQEAQNRLS